MPKELYIQDKTVSTLFIAAPWIACLIISTIRGFYLNSVMCGFSSGTQSSGKLNLLFALTHVHATSLLAVTRNYTAFCVNNAKSLPSCKQGHQ